VRVAITRRVSRNIGRCELTHLERAPIDVPAAAAQHQQYERCLADLQCEVVALPQEPDLPDSVFVEDTAVVLDELAIITRPGAASRRPETTAVAGALRPYRKLAHIREPGTLEGGDVLVVGRDVYVGLSARTNEDGFGQLRDVLTPLGYSVTPVRVEACLHLKSAVTRVGDDSLLINRSWVDGGLFTGRRLIDIDPAEPFAANALRVGETVVYPAAYGRTGGRLRDAGFDVAPVDVTELAKAEGGVTCCSLILEVRDRE
jgi:dimethylargininase